MSLRKVLLIEDVAAEADMHRELLRTADSIFEGRLKIDIVGTWKEACERVAIADAQGDPYDAVSLDLGLPDTVGANGTIMELQGVSRQWPPVVVVTGYLDNPTRVKALMAGAEAVVGKDELGTCPFILWRRLHDEALKRTLPRL